MTRALRLTARAAILIALVLPAGDRPAAQTAASAPQQAAAFVCPMHPDVRSTAPGKCSICGMALINADPLAAREYLMDIRTAPTAVLPGQPFRLLLTVRDPDSKSVVALFDEVHEKRFHLFVISQDLDHYAHVHPEQQLDGSWALDVAVPEAGYYKIYGDFLPTGGTPQVIARALVTAGFTGDLASSGATLTPDRSLRKTVGSMSVALELPSNSLVAGREEKFVYHITDASTGVPVNDIEPYLGAWGHSLVMSEDTSHFVHAHPIELLPEEGMPAQGGPTLTFKALLPAPGRYRIWTQIQRGGEVETAVFTVAAASPTAQ